VLDYDAQIVSLHVKSLHFPFPFQLNPEFRGEERSKLGQACEKRSSYKNPVSSATTVPYTYIYWSYLHPTPPHYNNFTGFVEDNRIDSPESLGASSPVAPCREADDTCILCFILLL